MRWWVDGYNVIRRAPELAAREQISLQAGRAALCRLLATAAQGSGDQFTVVFDGARGGGSAVGGPWVRVLFSSGRETADDLLARLARAGDAVVSNDREVCRAAASAGAIAIAADEFLSRLRRPASPGLRGTEEPDIAPPRSKKGNPRRPSKKARAAARTLGRLDRTRPPLSRHKRSRGAERMK